MTFRTLNCGKYGIFLIMGNAGFCPSAVVSLKGAPSRPSSRCDSWMLCGRGDRAKARPLPVFGSRVPLRAPLRVPLRAPLRLPLRVPLRVPVRVPVRDPPTQRL